MLEILRDKVSIWSRLTEYALRVTRTFAVVYMFDAYVMLHYALSGNMLKWVVALSNFNKASLFTILLGPSCLIWVFDFDTRLKKQYIIIHCPDTQINNVVISFQTAPAETICSKIACHLDHEKITNTWTLNTTDLWPFYDQIFQICAHCTKFCLASEG